MKKKIILVLIIFILTFMFSFFYKKDNIINYTLLGDKQLFSNNIISKNFSDLIYERLNKKYKTNYNKSFIEEDIRIVDIINTIDDNIMKDDQSIQKVLKSSNILLINSGNSEIDYKLSKIDPTENNKEVYLYIDETLKDYSKLITKIKKYNDNEIIVLGVYNEKDINSNKQFFDYFNKKLHNLCKKNDITFINIYNILYKNSDYLQKTDRLFITNKGNLALFYKIYSKINKLYLHKNL